jgi:hypothetical protein
MRSHIKERVYNIRTCVYRFGRSSWCGSLPWEPPTGYQITTEVTNTQIGIQATARYWCLKADPNVNTARNNSCIVAIVGYHGSSVYRAVSYIYIYIYVCVCVCVCVCVPWSFHGPSDLSKGRIWPYSKLKCPFLIWINKATDCTNRLVERQREILRHSRHSLCLFHSLEEKPI